MDYIDNNPDADPRKLFGLNRQIENWEQCSKLAQKIPGLTKKALLTIEYKRLKATRDIKTLYQFAVQQLDTIKCPNCQQKNLNPG